MERDRVQRLLDAAIDLPYLGAALVPVLLAAALLIVGGFWAWAGWRLAVRHGPVGGFGWWRHALKAARRD